MNIHIYVQQMCKQCVRNRRIKRRLLYPHLKLLQGLVPTILKSSHSTYVGKWCFRFIIFMSIKVHSAIEQLLCMQLLRTVCFLKCCGRLFKTLYLDSPAGLHCHSNHLHKFHTAPLPHCWYR